MGGRSNERSSSSSSRRRDGSESGSRSGGRASGKKREVVKLADNSVTANDSSAKRDKRNVVKLGDMISVRQPGNQSSRKPRTQSHADDSRSQSSHAGDEDNKRSRTGRNV